MPQILPGETKHLLSSTFTDSACASTALQQQSKKITGGEKNFFKKIT